MDADRKAGADASPDRQVLCLDGGGIRGAISVAFLERIEALCRAEAGPELRLADRFHLIGGTSTGSIIATGLALGLSTEDIKRVYFELAPKVFRRSLWRVAGLHTRFDAMALRTEISRIVGDRRLDTPDLRTLLAIVMKRMDTGGAWIVTNNPRGRYWEEPEDGSYLGNRSYRLADLVRASTAAPYYFEPQEIEIVRGAPPGLFVDGGITPHNNPALALFLLATIPSYGFGWPTGADRLRIVSIGTGARRETLSAAAARRMPAAGLAVQALKTMVADSGNQVLTLMQALGRTAAPWTINTEIGDLAGVCLTGEPLFSFQRYDVRLDREWLARELSLTVSERALAGLSRLDNSAAVPLAYEIGQAAAERFVHPEHVGLPSQPVTPG